jgi:hypothetical protein
MTEKIYQGVFATAVTTLKNDFSPFDHYPPATPVIKSMSSHCYGLPKWNVRRPLIPCSEELEERILADFNWDCKA